MTVYGYFDGVAAPALRIQAARIEDKGVVEVIYFSEDFEWLLPGQRTAVPDRQWKTTDRVLLRRFTVRRTTRDRRLPKRCWLTDTDWKKVAVLLSTCRNVT